MAKKAALSPRDRAVEMAQKIVANEAKAKTLKEEAEALKEELRQYVELTKDVDLGALMAYRRAGAVKLLSEDLTEKELEYAQDQLQNELPDFVTRKLDITKMFNAVKTNVQVANALSARGLRLEQETAWQFKAVK